MIADERKQNKIQCKICKKWFIFLGSHVTKTHEMLMRDYKKKFGYNLLEGLVPKWYSKKLSSLVTDKSKTMLIPFQPENKSHKRQVWSKEQREKYAGYTHSAETRKKISVARRKFIHKQIKESDNERQKTGIREINHSNSIRTNADKETKEQENTSAETA